MDRLTPAQCVDIIKTHRFAVQKKYGQNFLTDTAVLEEIADAAGIGPEDCVLEIGPGMGALTGYLLDTAGRVIAVEIDKMLIPILEATLGDHPGFLLLNADIMKVDIPALVQAENAGRPLKVVANLPYYITTPIVLKLLEMSDCISSITVMVQKEVAERMQEGPGSKAYGALSLAVQYYSRAQIVMQVSRNSFFPRPDVDSAVIRMDLYRPDERPVQVKDPDLLFRIIRAAFNQRRKTLVNGLLGASDLHLNREQAAQALRAIGKEENVRGETFTLEDFAAFADAIGE